MNICWIELKHAARGIAARPAFSALVVGVLAAGLACVIFMMTFLNGMVLRPLPFAAPEQLLQAGIYQLDFGTDYLDPLRGKDLLDIRRQLNDSAQVAGFARATMNLTDIEMPERDYGAFVSANLFGLLGVAPLLGRDFLSADQRDGAPAVAMLSHELWQSRYGGDAAIVGRQIRINAKSATVIGVMPQNFSFPNKETVWMLAPVFEGMKTDDLSYSIVVRRGGNTSNANIAAALDIWFVRAAQAEPDYFRGKHAAINSLATNITFAGPLHKLLYTMLAAVFMLLLVACTNVGNLMLGRMLERRHEIAVRITLGATRQRLILHLLMESLLLSMTASAVAVLVAGAGVRWLLAWFRTNDFGPAHWQRFDIDATLLLFVLATALITALATGLPAAWSASNGVAANNLRDGSRGVTRGSLTRMRNILVISQVALSCALLVSVGMMVRNIVSIDNTDIGIDTRHLLMARVVLSSQAYPTGAEQLRLYERVADQFRTDRGIDAVSVGTAVPGTYWNEDHDLLPVGAVAGEGSLSHTKFGAVDDQFLATFGVRLQQGRFFDSSDSVDSPHVAVVDRRFVDRFSADTPILGRQFRLDPRNPGGANVTVIGVIDTVSLNTQHQPPQPTMLIPLRQGPFRVVSVTVRTNDDFAPIAARLSTLMRQIDADTPANFRAYPTIVHSQTNTVRMVSGAFNVMGIVALVLVGIGLYGVVAVTVSQRTREIGVRRALGAPSQRILRNMFARTTVQLAIGLALGLAAGIPFARILDDSLLASGSSADPVVALSAALVMMLAATLAMIVPARRALRVDPIVALRNE